MTERPAILAHRGASADYPENTLLAFRRALLDTPPADGFECDVRLTCDGHPVVFHDDDTQRLCACPGTIEARTLAEVRALRVGQEPVPTLAELLELVASLVTPAPVIVNVELKPTGRAEPLITACRSLLDPLVTSRRVDLVVSSFDPRVLSAAFESGVPWRLAFLYETQDAMRFLTHLDPSGPLDLHPDQRFVDAAHLARYAVSDFDGTPRRFRTWTVDDPTRAAILANLGIDAIITNRPQALKDAL